MKTIAVILVSLCNGVAGSPAIAASCKDQATAQKLSGAAQTSFMNKCKRDAQASCDSQAKAKKLSGAAKTSFTKKCVSDATGS